MLDVSSLRPIAMRGRVAFGLMCLEEAILQYFPSPSDWRDLLAVLWDYTSTLDLDEWQERVAEAMPHVILDATTFDDGGFEKLTQGEYECLRKLYANSPALLRELVEIVFEIGTVDMFGDIAKSGAPESLQAVQRLVRTMNSQALTLPPFKELRDKSFAKRNGWGDPFDSTYLRRLALA